VHVQQYQEFVETIVSNEIDISVIGAILTVQQVKKDSLSPKLGCPRLHTSPFFSKRPGQFSIDPYVKTLF